MTLQSTSQPTARKHKAFTAARVVPYVAALALGSLCLAFKPAWSVLWATIGIGILVESVKLEGRAGKEARYRTGDYAYQFLYTGLALFGCLGVILWRFADNAVAYIALIAAVTIVNDTVGLIVGERFGRTHPFRDISKNKSVEGYLGGYAASIAVGYIVILSTGLDSRLPLWMLILTPIFGSVGDLLESGLKRRFDVKDMGHAFGKEHGGFADRFDAIPFAFLVNGIIYVLTVVL